MRRCTTHALYRSKLWQQDHCQYPQKSGLPRITGTCPGWNKVSGYGYGLWCGFKWGPHHATSHLRSRLESQHQSVPGCAEECDDPTIRWPVADPGCDSRTRRRPTSPKRLRLGFKRSATTLYASLTAPLLPWPEPTGLLRLVIRREHHQHELPQHQSQPDRHREFAELPPALVEKACTQFSIRIEAVIETEGGYIE